MTQENRTLVSCTLVIFVVLQHGSSCSGSKVIFGAELFSFFLFSWSPGRGSRRSSRKPLRPSATTLHQKQASTHSTEWTSSGVG